MIDFSKIKSAYFIGIGGIGMSALARHFNTEGVRVFGYDKVKTGLTTQLEIEGMKINYEDDVRNIPLETSMVVYTPAIPKDHKQLNYFLNNNYPVKKRSEVLQELTDDKFSIAVGGSHGKTSVTTLIAHILKNTGFDCTAFLGGISINYNSNYLRGKNNVVVVEADEFDRSFLLLNPDIAVITAVDADHLDIYGSFEKIEEAFIEFTGKVKQEGILVAQGKVGILPKVKNKKVIKYSYSDSSADYHISNASLRDGFYAFNISGKDGAEEMSLKMGGKHNVENALAAYCVARQLGIEKDKIRHAISEFRGVKRRFEHIVKTDKIVYIDDYAHHPEEIRALLESVRTVYPGKKITAIFQPHLYSRTSDLHKEFAASLDKADEIALLDIYPAREKPLPGVSSEMISRNMRNTSISLVSKGNLLGFLKNKKPEVLLTIGAGDIDTLVEPIKKFLEQNLNS